MYASAVTQVNDFNDFQISVQGSDSFEPNIESGNVTTHPLPTIYVREGYSDEDGHGFSQRLPHTCPEKCSHLDSRIDSARNIGYV